MLTLSGGSTTSGNGGAQAATAPPTAAARIPHAPTVSAASYRHAAEVGALFIGPPLFPAFGVVVADVFDAQLLVFVLQHPVGRIALFCGVRRANRVTFGDPRAVRFRMAAPAERYEVAGRVIAAAAAMNDVMNLQAVRVVAQRAAVAVPGETGAGIRLLLRAVRRRFFRSRDTPCKLVALCGRLSSGTWGVERRAVLPFIRCEFFED